MPAVQMLALWKLILIKVTIHFLLDVPEFLKTISEFINSTYNEIKNEKRI